MKVLTIKQPWASLIRDGYKKYEFRSWKTNYRGEIIIHAGKGIDSGAIKAFLKYNLEYPKSQIICKATLVDCIPLDNDNLNKIINENPEVYGYNMDKTGYAWKLDNIELIDDKREIKGKLGLWNL